jgi:hypothetical protein
VIFVPVLRLEFSQDVRVASSEHGEAAAQGSEGIGADPVPRACALRGLRFFWGLTYTPRLRLASRKAASVIARAPLTRENRFR